MGRDAAHRGENKAFKQLLEVLISNGGGNARHAGLRATETPANFSNWSEDRQAKC
jgi:hypothetical protein